jgi:hypothetical protein
MIYVNITIIGLIPLMLKYYFPMVVFLQQNIWKNIFHIRFRTLLHFPFWSHAHGFRIQRVNAYPHTIKLLLFVWNRWKISLFPNNTYTSWCMRVDIGLSHPRSLSLIPNIFLQFPSPFLQHKTAFLTIL